jgi:hypothetical protein
VRIAVKEGPRQFDAIEQLGDAMLDLRFRREAKIDERLGDLVAQPAKWIERRKRVLEVE